MLVYSPLMILGGMGLIFILIGFLVSHSNNKRRARCTEKTTGKVVKYCFPGNKSVGPVAEFHINSKKYRVKKRYRAFSRITHHGRFKDLDTSENTCYVDKNDIFHISAGNIVNYRELGATKWPIGSDIDVFYDPEDPATAYLERVPKKGSIFGFVSKIVGGGLVILGIVLTSLFIAFLGDEFAEMSRFGKADYKYNSNNYIGLTAIYQRPEEIVIAFDNEAMNSFVNAEDYSSWYDGHGFGIRDYKDSDALSKAPISFYDNLLSVANQGNNNSLTITTYTPTGAKIEKISRSEVSVVQMNDKLFVIGNCTTDTSLIDQVEISAGDYTLTISNFTSPTITLNVLFEHVDEWTVIHYEATQTYDWFTTVWGSITGNEIVIEDDKKIE